MSRLNSFSRETIMNFLIARKFDKRKLAMAKRADELATNVLKHRLGANYDQVCKLVSDGVLLGGSEVYVHDIPNREDIELEAFYPVPTIAASITDFNDSEAAQLVEFEAARRKMWSDKQRTINKVRSILNSVNSLKQLYEVWPALKTVKLPIDDSSSNGGIACIPAELNEDLDLPASPPES